MSTTNLLRPCALFNGLSDEQLNSLTLSAQMVTAAAYNLLFTEGQRATDLYVMVEGQVALEMTFPKSLTSPGLVATVCTLGPPQAVGLWSLVRPYFYTFSARALRRVDCLAIDGEALRKAMADDVQMGFTLMQNVAELLTIRLDQTREALGQQTRVLASLFTK